MKKKLLGILLTAMLVVCAFTICTSAATTTITTADELIALMNSSAPATDWAGDYVLGKSINLSTYTGELKQAPIGNKDIKFTGSFDGKGFEISGVDIVDNNSVMGIGFFGGVNNGTIKNLTVTGSVSSSGSRTGGLVGYAYGDIVIDNCTFNGSVYSKAGAAGGILGVALDATAMDTFKITNCVNNGSVEGTAYNGGIVGYIVSSSTASSKDYTIEIDNCVNTGAITSTGTSNYAGGILGLNGSVATKGTSVLKITNCANYGAISAVKFAGGIAGGIIKDKNLTYVLTTCVIDNCYNAGNVTATTQYAAGVIGIIRPALTTGADGYTISNIVTNDDAGLPAISVLGSGSKTQTVNYVITNAYTANGTDWLESRSSAYLTIDESTCYTANSLGVELAELAAEEKWVGSVFGADLADYHKHGTTGFIVEETGHYVACLCLDESTKTGDLVAHTFNDSNVCTACGYTACTHAAADYVVTKAATCLETGLKNKVCPTCETVLEEDVVIDIDPNAHAETGVNFVVDTEGKTVKYFHNCCDVFVFEDTTLQTTIYVGATGTDLSSGVNAPVGYTADTAFKNFEDAMVLAAAVANIKDVDVTIEILDVATITTASYATPAYENMVTITGGELAFAKNITRFFQHGDVTVRDVKINNITAVIWSARGNKVVMDTGITHAEGAANLYLLGGFQSTTAAEFTPDVTVRSGDWYCVTPGNRQQGSAKACVTDGTITLGTVNETDTLVIGHFYPFHMGGGEISADSTVDIIIDGKVSITDEFYANIQTTSTEVGDEFTYTVNYVLNNKADVVSELSLTNVAWSTIVWNVYVDERNEAAVADGARIVATDNITVNRYSYQQYCATVLNHNGTTSGTCEECGATVVDSSACTHDATELQTVTASTCSVKGVANIFCNGCLKVVGTEELELDATNHEANTNYVWTQNAESGAYEIICSACGGAARSQAELPTVYVGNSTSVGDDAADGFTVLTKVATLVEAVNRIKNVGGTVRINGNIKLDEHITLPDWKGTITFTSDTYDKYGAATAGFNITKQDVRLDLGGKANFHDIIFKGTSKKNAVNGDTTYTTNVYRAIISCNWHDVDFGYIRAQQYATVYLLAGHYGVTESDTEPKTTKMTIDGPALSTNALPYFYERVYLGSAFSKGGIEVSNKTVSLEVENGVVNTKQTAKTQEALIYTVYSMSTTGTNAYGTSQTNNCESTITLKDDSAVVAFRTGDRNVTNDGTFNEDGSVNVPASAAHLDKLTVNLLGNSQIADIEADAELAVSENVGSFQLKNVKETIINISGAEEGRTEKLIHSLKFYKYGTFVDTEATITVNGGSHSFINSITDHVDESARTNNIHPYTILKDVVDECEGNWGEWEITTEAVPGGTGIKTKTCKVCGRTESMEYDGTCVDHNYIVSLDNRYYCSIDNEIVAAPEGGTIIALTPAYAKDGKVSVNVTVSSNALWSALFTVNAPAGFELVDATSTLDGDFTFVGATELALPYSMAVMGIGVDENGDLANNSIDDVVVTLTFDVTDAVEGSLHVFTVSLDGAYNSNGDSVEAELVCAEVFACAHADTTVTTTADCYNDGVKTTVCNVCGDTIETVADTAFGHDWNEGEVVSELTPTTPGIVRYTCQRCGEIREDITLPAGSGTLTAVAGQIVDGKVSVELCLDAEAIAGLVFTVDASAGLTLESVNDNASDDFYLEAAENLGMPCNVMLVNLNGNDLAVNGASIATLVFAVDEDAMGANGEVIITAVEAITMAETGLYLHTVNGTVAHNCKYECVFVADTAEKDAHYLYTCTVCGASYEEVAEAEEYTVSYGSTVILESDLGLQIVANVADKITDASKIWLIVESTDANGEVKREVVNPYQAYPSNKEEGIFIYRFNATRISAKNIADDVSVTLCVEKDGVKYQAPTVMSSIITYYAAAKNANAPAAIIKALDAMMNYGAAAQEFFNYNTANLATTLTGTAKIDYTTDTSVSVDATTTYGDENISTYTYKSLSAILEDKVVMVIKYNGAAIDGLVFKGSYKDINGNDKTFEKAAVVKDGVVTVEVDAIAAKDLRQAFTGALYNGGEQVSSSITTSFEAYATQAIKDINNSLLNAVCRAALAYSDAAAEYFRAK